MSFTKNLTLYGKRVIVAEPYPWVELRYAKHRTKKGPRRMRTYCYRVDHGLTDILEDGQVIGSDSGLHMNRRTYDRLKNAIDNQRVS